jgi:hypothetical protein
MAGNVAALRSGGVTAGAATGLPYATRAVGEHRTIVRILEKVRVNPVPGRPDLFDPDLEALDRNWTINR